MNPNIRHIKQAKASWRVQRGNRCNGGHTGRLVDKREGKRGSKRGR